MIFFLIFIFNLPVIKSATPIQNTPNLISSTSTGCVFRVAAQQDTNFVLVGVPPRGSITVEGGELIDTVWIRRHRVAKILILPTGEAREVKVQWSGAKQSYELVENTTFEDILKRYVINYETSKYWLDKPNNETTPFQAKAPGICKILVDSEGLYRINYSDIIGVTPEIATADPKTIKITYRGLELPIFVKGEDDGSFGQSDWIEFYAHPPEGDRTHLNLYTYENVYWLSIGGIKGARLVTKKATPGIGNTPTYYPFTIHFELDSVYNVFQSYPDTIAPWFWSNFNTRHDFYLRTPFPIDSGNCNVKLTVRINGGPGNLQAYLNNNLIGTINFSSVQGIAESLLVTFPQTILQDSNILTLIPNNTTICFDFIEINYLKSYDSYDGELKFTSPQPGRYKFTLSGFKSSEIRVWQVGTAIISYGQIRYDTSNSTYTFNFEDTYSDSTFYLAQDYVLNPTLLRDTSANLDNPSNTAEYIIITAPKLVDCATRYAAWKNTQGFNCKVVTTEDIYDEFNYGIPHNTAIKKFLSYAFKYWASPPSYVLLLGDASFDHRNISGFDEDIVPAISIYDKYYILIPSDNIYACVSGTDPIPDILIGRLPIKDTKEFEIVFNKLQHQIPFSEWRKNLVFSTMAQSDSPIQIINSMIQKFVPNEYEVKKCYYPFSPQSELIDAINKGTSFLTYVGHSGPREWSGGLLWNEALPGLMNPERLPFVQVLGCYNAIFDVPGQKFMAENFILVPGGAFAYWGSAGATFSDDKGLIEGPLSKAINNSPSAIGELTFEGIIRCFAHSQTAKSINQQILLGDPAAKFTLPQRLTLSIAPSSISSGDTSIITGRFSTGISGSAVITVFIDDTTEFKKIRTDVNNGNWEIKLYLPDTINTCKGKILAYAYNDTMDFIAETKLTINKTNIVISTIPSKPTSKDLVYIKAKIFDPAGIRLVKCNWGIAPPPWNRIDMELDTSGYYITKFPIPPEPPKTLVSLQVYVENNLDSSFSEPDSYKILSLPEITDLSERIKLDGERSVRFEIPIINRGEQATGLFDVRVFAVDSLEDTIWLGKVDLELLGGETKNISVPWNLKKGGVSVFIDSSDIVEESDESDNTVMLSEIHVNLFNVTPLQGTNGWVSNRNEDIICRIFPQTVQDSTVLEILSTKTGDSLKLRTDISVLKDISIVIRNSSLPPRYGTYRWCERYKQWLRVSNDTISNVRKLGIFKVMGKEDTIPPIITLNINDNTEFKIGENQMTLKIEAIISDKSGIDIIDRGIVVEHDTIPGAHDTIPSSFYTYPTEENSFYALPLNMGTTIGIGRHTFRFIAYDLHGNKTIKQINIVVKPKFEQGPYCWGNYPNPVNGDKTEFRFGFTDKPDEVTVKIYTMSGKLIQTITPATLSKDIVIPWDLRAKDGTLCGNDVYFYKVYAKQAKVKIERLMKLAILR